MSDLEDYETPDGATRFQSRASSRRDLSTEAMINGRSHGRNSSSSTDTLSGSKPIAIRVKGSPPATQVVQHDAHDSPEIAPPEEARVRGNSLYLSRIWRQNP